jgi:hypothetical protein
LTRSKVRELDHLRPRDAEEVEVERDEERHQAELQHRAEEAGEPPHRGLEDAEVVEGQALRGGHARGGEGGGRLPILQQPLERRQHRRRIAGGAHRVHQSRTLAGGQGSQIPLLEHRIEAGQPVRPLGDRRR